MERVPWGYGMVGRERGGEEIRRWKESKREETRSWDGRRGEVWTGVGEGRGKKGGGKKTRE